MVKKDKADTKKLSLEEEYIKHQQDALFREVDEQVRIENMRKFWKKYGNVFIGIILLIMLTVISIEIYKKYKQNIAFNVSNDYLSAMFLASAGNNEAAVSSFNRISKENKNGLGDFAALFSAELTNADSEEFLKLTERKDIYPPLKDYLILAYAYRNIDTKTREEITDILSSVENKPTWKSAIMEIKALSSLKAGDKDEAVRLLTAMTEDAEISASFKSRANKILQTIKK